MSNATAAQIDMKYWKSVHPDWILYQQDGQAPAWASNTFTPLDFTNPDLLAEMLKQTAPYFTTPGYGYSALSMDVVFLVNYYGAVGVYKNGVWAPLFSGATDYEPDCPGAAHCSPTCLNGPYCDNAYTKAVITWLQRWRDEMHALGAQLVINVAPYGSTGGYVPSSDPTLNQAFDIADGVLFEGGFTGGGANVWSSGALWSTELGYLEAMKNGKPFYNKNAFADPNLQLVVQDNETAWALASNLMANTENAPIYVCANMPAGDPEYNLYYAQLKRSVGAACGRVDNGDLHTRVFGQAFALVNAAAPGGATAIVPLPNLPSGAQFADYKQAPVTLSSGCPSGESCVSMPPQSALVLYPPPSVTLGCECRVNGDCASSANGHVCVSGRCTCSSNSDCASSTACDTDTQRCDCKIPHCPSGSLLCDCPQQGCDLYHCFPNTLAGRQSCFNLCGG
jgi:hypothetical protein